VEVEAGTEVSASPGKDDDARLAGIFDLLDFDRQLPSQGWCERVSASRTVNCQPVSGTTGLGEEFAGHVDLVLGVAGRAASGMPVSG
jgi:hypothetical protein